MTEPQPFTVPVGSRVYLGEPAQEPVQLLETIGAALAAVPAVREARRVWVVIDDGAPGLVIGIDVEPDQASVRRDALSAVARAQIAAPVRFLVGAVFVQDRGLLAAWMAENAIPFFRAQNP